MSAEKNACVSRCENRLKSYSKTRSNEQLSVKKIKIKLFKNFSFAKFRYNRSRYFLRNRKVNLFSSDSLIRNTVVDSASSLMHARDDALKKLRSPTCCKLITLGINLSDLVLFRTLDVIAENFSSRSSRFFASMVSPK